MWRHRSRDDSIPHMRFPIGPLLEASLYLQAFSRYSAPKCLSSANRHCACAISRDLYPLSQIWVYILVSHPLIAYSLWHFHWAPMKNKGCLLLRFSMLKAKSSENFKNLTKFDILGGLLCIVQGVQKFSIFSAKGTSLRESTSFEPFRMKIGWGGLTSRSVPGKKARKSQRLP